MRALPSFSLSTLGQLAGPPAIRWPDCCSSGWPVSTSRATVLHFPKTSGNTVVHLRYDQQMFSIGDFDLSFLIQGVQGGFSITTSTTPRQSTARHRAKHRVMSHSANLCPASDSIYLILYVEFRHLTVFALYRMEIYPAQPMSGSPFRQRQRFRNGEQLEISCKTVFCQPPRFRAACNKSKSELPEFNSAEFGLIFLSPENGLFRPIPRVE